MTIEEYRKLVNDALTTYCESVIASAQENVTGLKAAIQMLQDAPIGDVFKTAIMQEATDILADMETRLEAMFDD